MHTKQNLKSIIIICVGFAFLGSMYLVSEKQSEVKKSSAVVEEALSVCPYTLVEDTVYQVSVDDCILDPHEPVENHVYVGKNIIVKAKSDGATRVYPGSFVFVPGQDGPQFRMIENADHSYMFLDQGTSLVRGLTIFSLTGEPRKTNIVYVGGNSFPTTTINGYLLYSDRSQKYVGVRETEISDALDLHAMKLSDFSDHIVYKGNAKTDYGIVPTKAELEKISATGQFVIESKDKKLTVAQTTWSGLKNKEKMLSLKISDLGKK